jgi:serine/threonine-protein kinase
MSPEQAAGRLDQLGPASDVYSLGATLSCLLTGKPPVEGSELEVVLARVQRGEIRPPRAVDPRVPPALEAICLKAMALRPEDRYPGSRALAEDLERWLADEPVVAYPEPWTNRLGRWSRRHRTAVTAMIAAVTVAAVCFAAATALLAAANERERTLAELARRNGESARSNFRLAFDGVDRYFTQVSEDRLLNVPGLQPVRRQLLEAAREFYGRFLDERHDDPTVRAELGRGYLRLARIAFETDATAKAVDLAHRGLAILEPLGTSRPSDVTIRKDVAAGLASLGTIHAFRREIEPAEKAFRESIQLWESLTNTRRDDFELRRNLCKTQTELGHHYAEQDRTADARRVLLAARTTAGELVKAHPGDTHDREALQRAEAYLGDFFTRVGELTAAGSSFRASLEAIDELAEQRPSDLGLQFIRSATLARIGEHLRELGRLDEAERTFAEAASSLEKLVRENPTVVAYRRALCRLHVQRGAIGELTGKPDEAERHHGAALEIAEALVRDNPDVPDLQNEVAVALSGLFNVHYGAGRMEQAAAVNRRARQIREYLARQQPRTAHFQDVLAQTRNNQALESPSRPVESLAVLRESIAAQRRLVRDHPEIVKYRFVLATDLNTLGGLWYRAQRHGEALAAFRDAIAEWRELVRREPEVPYLRYELGRSLSNLAGILTLIRQYDRALPVRAEAVDRLGHLVREHPQVVEYQIALSAAEDIAASIARHTNDRAAARAGYGRSIRVLEEVLRRDPRNRKAQEFLLTSRNNRAVLMIEAGDHRGAWQELDAMTREPVTAAQRYNLGCAFALLSAAVARDASLPRARRDPRVGALAGRAVHLLGEAAAARYLPPATLAAQIQADSDLDSLRGRDDFRQLVAGLLDRVFPHDPFVP